MRAFRPVRSIQQGPTSEHGAGQTAKMIGDSWPSVPDDVQQPTVGALRSPPGIVGIV